jgi:hypothetical protein
VENLNISFIPPMMWARWERQWPCARLGVEDAVISSHQVLRDFVGHNWRSRGYSPRQSFTNPQTLVVNRQWTSKCTADSLVILAASGQRLQWGISTVMNRMICKVWAPSKIKILLDLHSNTKMFFFLGHVCYIYTHYACSHLHFISC